MNEEYEEFENNIVALFRNIAFALIIGGLMLWLTGCASDTLNKLHSEDITQGCEMVEASVKLGYFNQEGMGSACKMICSPDLPEGYSYSYDDGRCKASIGK